MDKDQGTTSESGKSNDTAEEGASDGKSSDISSVEPDTTPITEGDFALAVCVKQYVGNFGRVMKKRFLRIYVICVKK